MTAAETKETLSPDVQVTITGRNVEVPDHFAERVENKLAKVSKLDPSLAFFHVELLHEKNPSMADRAERIQITATGKGHLVRAEANEDSFYAALETAIGKMTRSLHKVKARRSIAHTGHRVPMSMGEAAAQIQAEGDAAEKQGPVGKYDIDPYENLAHDEIPGQIVRTKTHAAKPMSVEDACGEMELVGHDFYLFINEETGCPSVVYRRRGYDYGLIQLKDSDKAEESA